MIGKPGAGPQFGNLPGQAGIAERHVANNAVRRGKHDRQVGHVGNRQGEHVAIDGPEHPLRVFERR